MEAAARMDEIRDSAGTSVLGTTHSSSGAAAVVPAPQVVRGIQTVLRSVASAAEIEGAAHALAPAYPHLAEFLRVYGAGRTSDAVDHYEAHQD